MKRWLGGAMLVLVLIVPGRGAEPDGKVLRESWFESRTEQGKLGYMHFVARAVERDGRRFIHTIIREELSYKRSGDPYTEKQDHETLESDKGEVVELAYSTNLSKKQQLALRGRVNGDELVLRIISDDRETKYSQKVGWDKVAVGLYAEDRFFETKPLKAGDVYTLRSFNPSINRVVTTTYTVKGAEKTRLAGEERELIRVEQTYAKELRLSKNTFWLDDQSSAVKMQQDTPLFGTVIYEEVSRDTALAKFRPRVADIESPIAINQPISFRKGAPKELTVRVTLEGDDEPGTLFAKDARQKVVKADREMVELQLLAPKKPEKKEKPDAGPAAYLESNFFIRSDDPLVQQVAKEAVGDVTDPREQTILVRKWFRSKFRGNYEVPFATADEVARCPEGDCSEMGILASAMCRSLGIPSRVAFGLVYDTGNPGFGGHLWTEVYLDGEWEPFDPTGVVHALSAAHIKIADYSLNGVLNPDELLEVRRVFSGKMKVEVIEDK